MKINVDQELLTMDGDPILLDLAPEKVLEIQLAVSAIGIPQESPAYQMEFVKQIKAAKKKLTLKVALIEALMLPAPDQEASIKNFTLAQSVAKGGSVELSAEQIVGLKGMLCKRYSEQVKGDDGKVKAYEPFTLIVGQACSMLEGKV